MQRAVTASPGRGAAGREREPGRSKSPGFRRMPEWRRIGHHDLHGPGPVGAR